MKNFKKIKIIIIVVICIIILSCIYIAINKDIFKSKETINLQDENIALNNIEDNLGNNIQNNIQNNTPNDVENEIKDNIENVVEDNSENNVEINVSENNIESEPKNNTEVNSETTTNVITPVYQKFSYGESENGRDLVYYSIAPENYTSTILMNFAIHGYEDAYAKDAQLLVDLAEYIKEHYKEESEELLYETRILIIPCANPDGLYEGTSNNGFGRCNAKGIDLNRDFDALHKVFSSARNYTQYPFSAKESQALRDLIIAEKPNVVLDFHGWENCTIGDANVASAFKTHVGLNHKTKFNSNCNGYFSYWAHLQGANSLLVEFKNTNISKDNVIKAIDQLLQEF